MPTTFRRYPSNRYPGFLTIALLLWAASELAQAQFFSNPGINLDWQTQQTARTFAWPSGDLLCETDWNADWLEDGSEFQIDELLREQDGGCPLVTLGRSGNLAATAIAGYSTSLELVFRIEALATTEIDRIGAADGSMAGTGTAWVQLDQWTNADALIWFVADIGNENATTSLTARFAGPIDPLTDAPVLVNESWTGTTRLFLDLSDLLFAPGRYELHGVASGSFMSSAALRYAAQVSASALIENPEPASPPPTWDLDFDGLVGLSDCCLWADSPSDADGNGTTDQADLELLMALARAGGQTVTDTDIDGIPDQCNNQCLADFNDDGFIDFFDLQTYLSAFASNDAQADINKDGILDFFDLLAFLNLFAAGCQNP